MVCIDKMVGKLLNVAGRYLAIALILNMVGGTGIEPVAPAV
jgi:hypothetical protein